ncbi:MAG: hypothetical protein DI629_07300 [Mesorhizobium amorphae]|nr:MAG: hypothetical protein DI629_07300 [Mesorhizobium amorphae]
MSYKPSPECFAAASAASGGRLTADEIEAAFQRVADHSDRMRAKGDTTGRAARLSEFATREGEQARIAAALQRRHANLNLLVRDRLNQTIERHAAAGLTPRQSLLAIMEGTARGVEGGRSSVDALRNAYEGRFVGDLFARFQAERPHLLDALRDDKLDADVLREMAELHEGGKPGVTGNDDARYVAKTFSEFAELARADLNRLGASIGKLDGWAGPQSHDDIRMLAAGKDAWVNSVLPKLDLERTFPDATPDEARGILDEMFDVIITGVPAKPTSREAGQRVNPANLAKSLGKSRVLHFRDAEAALAYRDEFGFGNTVSGIVGHMRRSARMASVMETFGPNPENMLDGVTAEWQRKVAHDSKLEAKDRQHLSNELRLDAGSLRNALDVATGLASRPVNMTAAKIGSDIRAMQSMAKLGGSVITSALDLPVAASASMFRGSGFLRGLTQQIGGILKGRPKGEAAEISYLLGEGFDGMLGHIVAPAAAQDSPVGTLSRLMETFFRWNGQSWWTDVNRATAARVVAAEMGMRSRTAFPDLPPAYRHVLGLNGITEGRWEAIRKAQFRVSDGRTYVTPDRIRDLADDDVRHLVADRIATADAALETRRVARRTLDARDREWLAGRRRKLDEWTARADARLVSMTGGRQIRTEIERQLVERRIDLEKAQIEEARTEMELLSAARESDATEDVRKLLQSARRDASAGKLEDKGERLVARVTRADFRDGQALGQRYQRALATIRDLRKQIVIIERKANKADVTASDRLNEAFQGRLAELNDFADRVYTREQARVDAAARDEAEHPERIAAIIDDGRRGLEMDVRRFVADETSAGILEADAASNRFVYRGNRPGTFAGEALRFVAQFKQFPTVFSQRVLGRAFSGHRSNASVIEKGQHIGALLAGLTVGGYMVMTMKELMRGYWPPRDPSDPKVLMAALMQSGAAGLYSDFLFADSNRYGGGLLETIAGPTAGTVAQALDLARETAQKGIYTSFGEDERFPAAQALNLAVSNTPGASLFYVRPALDYLFLNSLREAVSPGYLRRQERNRRRDYGQSTVPLLGDRQAF